MSEMSRRVSALVVAVVLATSCSPGGEGASSRSDGSVESADDVVDVPAGFDDGSWAPANGYEALAAEIGAAEDPLEAALQLFALQYGEVPGVSVPGDPGPAQSGDLAVSGVLAGWDRLDEAQREAVRDHLDLPDGWSPATPRSSAPADVATGNGGNSAMRGGRTHLLTTEVAAPEAYQRSMGAVLGVLERHLGTLPATISLVEREGARDRDEATVLADALLLSPTECRIRIFPENFPEPSGPDAALAHEVFHCFQQVWNDSPFTLPWVEEGTAQWAGAAAAEEAGGSVSRFVSRWLGVYSSTPETALFERTYDAHGWFAYVAEATGPLWDRLRAVTTAGSSEAAYAAAGGRGGGTDFAAEWATSQTALGQFGPRWELRGPGVVPVRNSSTPAYTPLAAGASFTLSAGAYATNRASMGLTAAVTRLTTTPGTSGWVVLDGVERPLADIAETPWCTDPSGDCTCPEGTRRAGETLPRLSAARSVLAVGGADGPAALTVAATTLEDECGEGGECPIGTFRLDTLPTGISFVVVSGGTGSTLTVDPSGALTMDYTGFVPIEAHDPGDPRLRSRFAPTGVITGRVALPPSGPPPRDVPVTDIDASGFGGTGQTSIGGVVVLEMNGADLAGIVGAGQGFGPTLLSCEGDDTVSLSAGGIVHTYERIS